MKAPVAGRTETIILSRMLVLDYVCGNHCGADAGLLTHESLRHFSVEDVRAKDIPNSLNNGSHPFGGHRRVGNALRSLKSKHLVERRQVTNDSGEVVPGQYRYYLTDLGRKKLERLETPEAVWIRKARLVTA